MSYYFIMKHEKLQYEFSADKNRILIEERQVSFEKIIAAISNGGLLDVLEHPNKTKYPNQQIYVIGGSSRKPQKFPDSF